MRLVLMLAGLSIGVTVSEVALRLAGYSRVVFEIPDSERGTSLRPFAKGWHTTEGVAYVQINSRGYRDRDRVLDKPNGTYRIAVLGDSFVEARQVAIEDTVSAVVARVLATDPRFSGQQVEVLNFGVSGYGTAQELLTLRRDVFDFQPDQVILAFFTGNDVSDNSMDLSHPMDARPYFVLRGEDLVLDSSFLQSPTFLARQGWLARIFYATQEHSRLIQLLYRASRQFRRASPTPAAAPVSPFTQPGLPHAVYREPENAAWDAAWRVTERLIRAMHAECLDRGIEFGVVTLTNPPQVFPDPAARRAFEGDLQVADLFYPDRRIKDLGEHAGFPVLSLAPPLQGLATERGVFLHGFQASEPGVGHWNEQGHRLAGELIAEWAASRRPR